MASLLGIDTNRVISFTFVLGAMLAAVGGVLIARWPWASSTRSSAFWPA